MTKQSIIYYNEHQVNNALHKKDTKNFNKKLEHGYFDKWYSEFIELLSTSDTDLKDFSD